jgi:hypothetical protein
MRMGSQGYAVCTRQPGTTNQSSLSMPIQMRLELRPYAFTLQLAAMLYRSPCLCSLPRGSMFHLACGCRKQPCTASEGQTMPSLLYAHMHTAGS